MRDNAVRRPVVPEAPSRSGGADDFDARALREETAARFGAAIDAGELSFPLPGSGATAERWGVWAAEPPGEGLSAVRGDDGRWSVSGLKQYCSGARSCTHALVTAGAEDGRRLFAVPLAEGAYEPVEGSWQALGMAGSDTPDVRFRSAAAEPVGGVEGYVERPGFQHGGIGVAACWLGGARAVARALRAAAHRGGGQHTDAHLGAVDMDLRAAGLLLDAAAADIDADPLDAKGEASLRACLRCGGYPALATGEDHALVTALRAGGHRVLRTRRSPVLTSARLTARARGGYGDHLGRLAEPARQIHRDAAGGGSGSCQDSVTGAGGCGLP